MPINVMPPANSLARCEKLDYPPADLSMGAQGRYTKYVIGAYNWCADTHDALVNFHER